MKGTFIKVRIPRKIKVKVKKEAHPDFFGYSIICKKADQLFRLNNGLKRKYTFYAKKHTK